MIFNRRFYRSLSFWLGLVLIVLNVALGWPVQIHSLFWWGTLVMLVAGLVFLTTGLIRDVTK